MTFVFAHYVIDPTLALIAVCVGIAIGLLIAVRRGYERNRHDR